MASVGGRVHLLKIQLPQYCSGMQGLHCHLKGKMAELLSAIDNHIRDREAQGSLHESNPMQTTHNITQAHRYLLQNIQRR